MRKEDNEVRACFFSASEYLTNNCKNLFKGEDSANKFLFLTKPISIPKMTKQIEHF
jgi:hypothetical protein